MWWRVLAESGEPRTCAGFILLACYLSDTMIHDRVSGWLRQLTDRLRYPGQSVQYELHRMTHKGGWRNFYTDPNRDFADAFSTPPPKPSFGSQTGYPPGRYRCLKRVNGRIKTILWTVESPDGDAYYTELREQAAAEAAAPSLNDVAAGLREGSTEPLDDWVEHHIE